jgi:two-component system, chemotaxis family, chemotaxis protein CheY
MNRLGVRVAVVDDDRLVRELLKGILREDGFQIVGEAGNGEAAITLCEAEKPDIVCLDVEMPRMNGIDVLKAIKAKCPSAHVIMFAGEADVNVNTVREAVTNGADGYIIKPFRAAKVSETIRRLVQAE